MDGTLSSPVWESAALIDTFHTAVQVEQVESTTEYRLGWYGDHLHLGGRIAADEIESLARVLIVIDADSVDDRFCVVDLPVSPIRQTGTVYLDEDWRPDHAWIQESVATEHAQTHDLESGDLLVEVALPLADLGVSGPPKGTWRFTVIQLTEFGTHRLTSWVPIHATEHLDASVTDLDGPVAVFASVAAQQSFGTLYFDRTPCDMWTPQSCSLQWSDFTTKRLTVGLPTVQSRATDRCPVVLTSRSTATVDWIEPDGTVTLVGEASELDGEELIIDLTHPAPIQDGEYRVRVIVHGPAGRTATTLIGFHREDLIAAGIAVVGERFPVPAGTAVSPSPASAEVMDLIDLLPEQFGIAHLGHPGEPDLRPQFANWTLAEDLQHIVYLGAGEFNGQTFPNETWAETKVDVAVNALGEAVEYPYHEDAQGRRYFFTAALWNHRTRYVREQLVPLATTDPLGAARLMYRFAEVSRGYVMRTNNEWNTYVTDVASGPPYNRRSGFWSVWPAEELNHFDLVLDAYEALNSTDAFQVLADELDRDVRADISDWLFGPAVDFVLSVPRRMHNVDPYIWRRLTRLARVVGVPDHLHLTLEWIEGFMRSQFLSDGFWKEVAPAYHQQVIGNVDIALAALAGYRDPAGYVSPRSGLTISDLDLSEQYPQLEAQKNLVNLLSYPSKKQVPIADTWAHTPRVPDPMTGPYVLSPSGLARLDHGTGTDRTQLHLMATPRYGHHQLDPLNIALFGQGHELLPDLGYTYTKYRRYSASTIGHNTVLVDGQDMTVDAESRDGGRMERLIEVRPGTSCVRASYPGAYPQTSRYQRELLLHEISGGRHVVIDLFRVSGGDRHEYVVHGDANQDCRLMTPLERSPYGPYLLPDGVEVRPPVDDKDFGEAEGHYPGYQYVRDVAVSTPGAGCHGFDLISTTGEGLETARLGVLTDVAADTDQIFIGTSPSLRMTRLHGNGVDWDNNRQADLYSSPTVVHRREGHALDSTFVTALETYRGSESAVELCRRIPIDSGPADAVAVRVVHGLISTLWLSNPSGGGEVVVGEVRFRGEWGSVTQVDGAPTRLDLIGGDLIRAGDEELTATLRWTGEVVDTERVVDGGPANTVTIATELPDRVVGEHVAITHPDQQTTTLRIATLTRTGGSTIIGLGGAESGFILDDGGGSHQTHFPARSWTGAHTATIVASASAEIDGSVPGLPTTAVSGSVTGADGAPIEGASVQLTGRSIEMNTAADGSFDLEVPIGDHHLTVRATGHHRSVVAIGSLDEGGTSEVTVGLVPLPRQPELTAVTRYQRTGEPVSAMCDLPADLYLVPANVAANPNALAQAVSAGSGVSAPAVGGVPVTLATGDLGVGVHRLYAVNDEQTVSVGHSVTLVPTVSTQLEDDNAMVSWGGAWFSFKADGHSGGSFRYAQERDAWVEFGFYGTRAVLLSTTNEAGGLGDVHVDGEQRTTVDFWSAEVGRKIEVFDTGVLDEGIHVVRMVTLNKRGEEHPASSQAQVRFDVAHTTGI